MVELFFTSEEPEYNGRYILKKPRFKDKMKILYKHIKEEDLGNMGSGIPQYVDKWEFTLDMILACLWETPKFKRVNKRFENPKEVKEYIEDSPEDIGTELMSVAAQLFSGEKPSPN